jgi:hypothetical protein
MVFSKNFLVVLLVLSTITLCLAKPRWVWLDEKDDEKDDGDWNDEVLMRKRGKNEDRKNKNKCEQLYTPPSCKK